MKTDYTINYVKNSILQVLTTGIGLLSLFIVVPFLSENKTLYGIYSVCISLNIFFNHADFGFLSAGQKYAGEFYAQGDLLGEERILSFTSFVILIFVTLIGIVLFPFVVNPELLISEIDVSNKTLARALILVLIISSPFIAIKRVCLISYACRIEQYKYQVVTLFGHLIKIFSVLYFFGNNKYELLNYFVFVQFVDVLCTIILFSYAIKKYGYSMSNLMKSFSFDKELWILVKGIVGASLISTISWILYYEMDLIILAKISTPEVLAVYSAAFTLLSISRSYFAVIYSSFSARYNHYVGLKNLSGLNSFFLNNIYVLFPFTFFPLCIFLLIGDPFVLSWVGDGYCQSVTISKILLFGSMLAFLSYPSGQYLFATNKIRAIYVSSIILPLIFWSGVFFTFHYLNILAFALFKAISQLIAAIYSFFVSSIGMKISIKNVLKNVAQQYWVPFLVTFCVCFPILPLMNSEKTICNLIINVLLIGGVFLLVLSSCLVSSNLFREYTHSILIKLRS